MRTTPTFLLAALPAVALLASARAEDPPAPEAHYRQLLGDFHTAAHAFYQAPPGESREEITGRVAELTSRCLALAERHSREPFALEALAQVVTQEYWLNNYTAHPGWDGESPQVRAMALMLRDHGGSEAMGPACKRVRFGFRGECETFFRRLLEANPHRGVQGLACLRLAQFLAGRQARLELLDGQADLAARYARLYGRDYLEALRARDPAEAIAEAVALYERAARDYADVKMAWGEVVGEVAERELFEIRHLSLGKVVPEIEGADQEGREFRLSDYRGKVVLLYFWTEY